MAESAPIKPGVVALLRRALQSGGVRGALEFISKRTQHRFVGVFRFDREMLRNQGFYDRDDPAAGPPADIPIMSSYCVFVRDGGKTFTVDDAASDERTAGHPKRRQLLSYCGVPLLDTDGVMYGTVCLYDVEPRTFHADDIELLESLGPLLRAHAG